MCHTLARPECHREESSAHEEDAREEARGVALRLGSVGLSGEHRLSPSFHTEQGRCGDAVTGVLAGATSFAAAACFLIFCLVPACFAAADFFAVCSASFASSFAPAFAFAALIVNSFAASSASKDSWRKFFGMRIVMPKPSA